MNTDPGLAVDDRARLQQHLAELSTLTLKKDQILYACEQMHRAGLELTGKSVMDWLAQFGVEVGRSSTSTVVTAWCREHDIVRTGDLPALTTEILAQLDTARAEHRAAAPVTEQAAVAATEQPLVTEQAGPNSEQPTEQSEHTEQAAIEQDEQPLVIEQPATEQVPVRTEQVEHPELDSSNGDDVPAAPLPVERTAPPVPVVPVRAVTEQASVVPEQAAPVFDRTEQPVTEQVVVFAPDTERTANEHRTPVPAPVTDAVLVEAAEESVEAVKPVKKLVVWPVILMALSAFVSIWSGWVGLGEMTGFGVVEVLPGISDFKLNTAITLPIGVEAYASYALYVWLSGRTRTEGTRRFAKWSAIASLALGAAGQIAYHLLMQTQRDELDAAKAAAVELAQRTGQDVVEVAAIAPWWITTFVACLPVIVVGMGAALAHMVRNEQETEQP